MSFGWFGLNLEKSKVNKSINMRKMEKAQRICKAPKYQTSAMWTLQSKENDNDKRVKPCGWSSDVCSNKIVDRLKRIIMDNYTENCKKKKKNTKISKIVPRDEIG